MDGQTIRKRGMPMFALRLRRARLNTVYRGERLRQADAAAMCGVSEKTYWRWENGEVLPRPVHIERVAELFKVSVDEVWLDVGMIPPDMQEFLVTTREGDKVVKNIRKIMEVMAENQQPTTRRGAPVAEKFAMALRRSYTDANAGMERQRKNREKRTQRRMAMQKAKREQKEKKA